jgi:hypothetical protein
VRRHCVLWNTNQLRKLSLRQSAWLVFHKQTESIQPGGLCKRREGEDGYLVIHISRIIDIMTETSPFLVMVFMSNWVFFGRTLPERFPVTLGTQVQGETKSLAGFSYKFRIAIHAAQVVADIDVTEGDPDLSSLRNSVANNVRTLLDIVGYDQGNYFDVDMLSASSKTTDDWAVFGIDIPVLASTRARQGKSEIPSEQMAGIMRSIPAQMVLADFREAMRVPIGTGFFCYRAIEAMMQSMKVSENEDEKRVWPRLRDNLRVERAVIDAVQHHAAFPRHGKPSLISDEERGRVFSLTDEIIRRFLAYEFLGRQQLPSNDFPIFKLA